MRTVLSTFMRAGTGVVAAVLLAAALGSAGQAAAAHSANSPSVQLLTRIPLPGSGGHGDLLAYDPSTRDVYVAHHGNDLVVIDTRTNKQVADVTVGQDPNGVAFDSRRVYVTTGKANTVAVVSKEDWRLIDTVPSPGSSPDAIWFDRVTQKLYVVSDDANDIEIFTSGDHPVLTGTIPLKPASPVSGPDVGTLVSSKGVIYEPDDSLVEVVDLKQGKVTRSVDTGLPLTSRGATKNMVLDRRTDHLWVATTAHKILVLDGTSLATLASAPATASDDQVAFDRTRRLLYAFGGTGFDVYDVDRIRRVASVNTGSGNTHTGTIDTHNHHLYVYEGDANQIAVYQPSPWRADTDQ